MSNKLVNGIVGFIVGATAGIVTGLLIAPRKGIETRQIIKEKAKKISETITDEFGDKIDEVQDKYKNIKEKVEEEVNKAREAVSDFAKPENKKSTKKK